VYVFVPVLRDTAQAGGVFNNVCTCLFQALAHVLRDTPQAEGVRLQIITADRFQDVFTHLSNNFILDEPINRAVGLEWHPDVEKFFVSALQQGLSIMATDETSGAILGVRISEIERDPRAGKMVASAVASNHDDDDEEEVFTTSYDKFQIVLDFINHENEVAGDIFQRYDVDEICHFVALSVDGKARGKGLGKTLLSVAVDFAKEIGCKLLKGEGSSQFSQKIYSRLGFDTLATVNYDDYKVDGKIVLQDTGMHTSSKIYVKVV
jgi:GNAT superfamily N-acetyltransferase